MSTGSLHILSRLVTHNQFWVLCCLAFMGFLLLFSVPGQAQEYFKFDKPRKKLSVKFTLHRNLIIVPVYLNDEGPFNFVLDTGVGNGIITDPSLLQTLALKKGKEIKITGAGSDQADLKAYIISNIKVKISDVSAPNLALTILSEDVFNLSSYVGMPIYGILGYQFFNSFVVRVNFNEAHLTLYPPQNFTYKKRDGVRIPFELDDQKPYIYAQVTMNDFSRVNARMIVDTGAGHAISLEQGSHPAIQLPEPALRTQLGTGLSGAIRGYLGRVRSFEISKYKMNNVLTSFPDHLDVGAKVVNKIERNGNVGNEVLKRFNVIIDYYRSSLTLKPNNFYRDPFEHDMCGIEIMAIGESYNRYIISKVEPGSPAAEADLKVNDEILFINSASAHALTISQIDKLLHTRDNFRLLIILRREGDLIYRFVTLKKRI
ncbi:MAG: aspartyl protease family protein [Adhaeribacter sp.]